MYPPIDGFYDRVTAGTLVRAAQAAYADGCGIREWANSVGCGECEVIEDERTETRVFAAARSAGSGDGFVIVCFRGTVDLRNWVTDLDVRRTCARWPGVSDQSGVEVHEGFLRALDSVWGRLAAVIERMALGKANVFFTGHSLGGALAMLALARAGGEWSVVSGRKEVDSGQWSVVSGEKGDGLATGRSPLAANHSPLVTSLYTFGQPRVGNAAWARWYDSLHGGRSFRVIHAEDVVARLPWLLDFYRHAGHEVFFPSSFRFRPSSLLLDCPWWRKLAGDVAGIYREWRHGRLALLADHHVEKYVKLLS